MTDYKKLSLEKHKKHKGKIAITSKVPLESKDDLATYYSPGVAQPCLEIAKDPTKAYDYTRKSNSIAVVSDGSAVLGLGNIGGLAGLPVMEGKAILFKHFGDVDTVPIILKTQDPDEIINIVENIAPTFGWINLEDIKAPQCFYIEEELKKRCNIPIFHDDQYGTAIVTLAWLINACKLAEKKLSETKIVISGAWAAGIAIAKLLKAYGAENIIMLDSKGATCSLRTNLNKHKLETQSFNKHDLCGALHEVIIDTDIFIGVSQPNVLTKEDVQNMAEKPIVFAMSNPDPEIHPDEAKKGGAYIMATGRSDFPNQVNNVVAFPGLFRGALDARIEQFEQKHFIAAAEAIANHVQNPTPENIIPSALDKSIATVVANAIKEI